MSSNKGCLLLFLQLFKSKSYEENQRHRPRYRPQKENQVIPKANLEVLRPTLNTIPCENKNIEKSIELKVPQSEKKYPYIQKKILTNAEISFYHCLRNLLADEHIIFCKVRLEDIINVKHGTENYNAERNKIKSKHVDFVICDSKTFEIQRVIELDDSSHENKKESDEFKDSAIKETGLIIVRCPAKRAYTNEDIAKLLN